MRFQTRSITEMIQRLAPADRQVLYENMSIDVAQHIADDWTEGGVSRRGQRLPLGDWTVWLLLAGRGYGKLACLTTPIPTPAGWIKNGDITDGCVILDQAGQPTTVTKAHPHVWTEDAYRVAFSDGTYIDACGDHLWTVIDHKFRKQLYRHGGSLGELGGDWPFARTAQGLDQWGNPVGKPARPMTLTTRQMIGELRQRTKRQDLNLSIPVAQPLQLTEKHLPIAPWSLGYMLGNIGGAMITTGSDGAGRFDHEEVLCLLDLDGVPTLTERLMPENGGGRIGIPSAFARKFHALTGGGGARSKFIPSMYLRASEAQRDALLRGLMDSDGHCYASSSQVEFCSMSEQLAKGVLELARSLGQKPVLSEGRAMLNGKDYGTKYRVMWWPTRQIFNLARKAERVTLGGSQFDRSLHRMIVSIEPIDACWMRCLTVDSPSALYLAGEAMIPTHNTRILSGVCRQWAKSGLYRDVGMIGATSDDARRILVEGPSGVLETSPNNFRPQYKKVDRLLLWPNGARTYLFSAEEPDRLRGGNYSGLLMDELAAWKGGGKDLWDQAMLTLRVGTNPRVAIATTPRPSPIIRQLAMDPKTFLTSGSSYDNRENLADVFLDQIVSAYEGTRLGQQELEGKILLDVAAPLWLDTFFHYKPDADMRTLKRVVVGVDPAGGGKESDATGIVVAGEMDDGNYIILEDATCTGSSLEWAQAVASAFDRWKADIIVAEVNFGGQLVVDNILRVNENLPIQVVTASRGKVIRAEPIATLYEQGKIYHRESFPELEEQMTQFDRIEGYMGKGSPDRVDSLVWSVFALIGGRSAPTSARAVSSPNPRSWKQAG